MPPDNRILDTQRKEQRETLHWASMSEDDKQPLAALDKEGPWSLSGRIVGDGWGAVLPLDGDAGAAPQ